MSARPPVTLSLYNNDKEVTMSANVDVNHRPEPDQVLVDIADYVCNHPIISEAALDTARYCLQDSGGRVAVYTCRADGTPGTLIRVTGIYTNLLPENDAVRIKRGVTVYSERELDLLLEDLGD